MLTTVAGLPVLVTAPVEVANMWCSKYLTPVRKVLVFRFDVLVVLLYGCEV